MDAEKNYACMIEETMVQIIIEFDDSTVEAILALAGSKDVELLYQSEDYNNILFINRERDFAEIRFLSWGSEDIRQETRDDEK